MGLIAEGGRQGHQTFAETAARQKSVLQAMRDVRQMLDDATLTDPVIRIDGGSTPTL